MERAERYAALNKARAALAEIGADHGVDSGFWGGRIAETVSRADDAVFEVLNALDSFTGDAGAREAMDDYQRLVRANASDDHLSAPEQVHTTYRKDN